MNLISVILKFNFCIGFFFGKLHIKKSLVNAHKNLLLFLYQFLFTNKQIKISHKNFILAVNTWNSINQHILKIGKRNMKWNIFNTSHFKVKSANFVQHLVKGVYDDSFFLYWFVFTLYGNFHFRFSCLNSETERRKNHWKRQTINKSFKKYI